MSILNTTTPEASARLVRKEGNPAIQGFVLTRSWPYVDAAAVDTLAAALDVATLVTDPQADAQTYAGSFAVSKVRSFTEETDGTFERYGVIIQTLTKVFTAITTAVSLKSAQYQVLAGIDAVEPFGLKPGDGKYKTYVFKHLDPTKQATVEAFTRTNLATIDTAYTFVKSKWEDEDDNTGTFTVLFEAKTFTNTNPDYANRGRDDIPGYGHTLTAVADGVALADAADEVDAYDQEGAKFDEAVLAVKANDAGDGMARITKLSQEGAERAIVTHIGVGSGTNKPTQVKTWYRVAPSNIAARKIEAAAWTGDEGEDYDHINIDVAVGSDGYATITSLARDEDYTGTEGGIWPWTESTFKERELFQVEDKDIRGAIFYKVREYTYTTDYSSTYGDAQQDYSGSLIAPKAGIREINLGGGSILFQATKCTNIRDLTTGWTNDQQAAVNVNAG
jgi:hypothetical protein